MIDKSDLEKVLLGSDDTTTVMLKYFSLNFSTYCAIINLKMMASLNEKMTKGTEPAEELLTAILTGWHDTMIASFDAEMAGYDKLMEDPFTQAITDVPSPDEMRDRFMEPFETFYSEIKKAVE